MATRRSIVTEVEKLPDGGARRVRLFAAAVATIRRVEQTSDDFRAQGKTWLAERYDLLLSPWRRAVEEFDRAVNEHRRRVKIDDF